MRRTNPSVKSFNELGAEIARTAVEDPGESPTKIPPGWIDPEPPKTEMRKKFELNPALPMRRPEGRLLDSDGPVDARWQRVCRHAHRRGPCPHNAADKWIDAGVKYLNAYLDCRGAAELEDLARQMPHLHAAYTLYRSEDKFLRGRLEGYLLTSRPFDDVARCCDLAPAAVETYEAMFFDVRRQLKHSIAICLVAFDGKFPLGGMDYGLREDDIDIHLRMAGLLHGGVALEPMIRYYSSGWQIPAGAGCPTRTEIVELRNMITMRLLILDWVMPPSKIGRVLILSGLLAELGQLIEVWPDGALAPTRSPFGSAPITDAQLIAWWGSWRNAMLQAAGTVPPAPARIVA